MCVCVCDLTDRIMKNNLRQWLTSAVTIDDSWIDSECILILSGMDSEISF